MIASEKDRIKLKAKKLEIIKKIQKTRNFSRVTKLEVIDQNCGNKLKSAKYGKIKEIKGKNLRIWELIHTKRYLNKSY